MEPTSSPGTAVPAGMRQHKVTVQGRAASYGALGEGAPVVFLHGWAVTHRTYREALERLEAGEVQVFAPTLPGFGGTARVPASGFSIAGYAAWVADFLEAVGVDGPVTLVGHSFGGGVAIKTAHDFPDLVDRLVLVNSIGGSAWRQQGERTSTLAERPLWDWGLHLTARGFSLRTLTRVLPVVAADAVPNAVRHPDVMWRVGRLARDADLAGELESLRARRLPVVIVWGREDTVLPLACAESLAIALGGPEVVTIPGRHSWLLEDPTRFAEVLTNVVGLTHLDPTATSSGPAAGRA